MFEDLIPQTQGFDDLIPKAPQDRGAVDKLFGVSGPRYQTWPERLVRGAISDAALPGEVYQDAQKPAPSQISDSDVSPLSAGRALGLATLANPVNPMVRSGDRAIPGVANTIAPIAPKVPNAQQLADISDLGYKTVRNMGVEFHPQFAPALGNALEKGPLAAYPPEVATGTYGIVKRLQQAPDVANGERAFTTFPQLEQSRQQLRAVGRNYANPTDQAAASEAISGIDEILAKLPEGSTVAGPAAAARKALEQSRGDWAASKRVNEITGDLDKAYTGIAERADLGSGAANSGRNYDNSLRQGLVSLLKSKKRTQGFTEDELSQVADVAEGASGANKLRTISNYLGGGGGLGASAWTIPSVAAAMVSGNPMAALPALAPAAGWVLKGLENRSARNAVNDLAENLAKRSPLYEQLLASAPREAEGVARKSALARGLMLYGADNQK